MTHEPDSHSGHHIVPIETYIGVFLGLMGFTALTVAAAFMNLGAVNNLVALGIATIKAFLVVYFFMHLKYNPRILWIVAGGGFLWLTVMILLTLSDLASRGWLPQPEAWL
jgi:cytochrome c oxidase subunit 4